MKHSTYQGYDIEVDDRSGEWSFLDGEYRVRGETLQHIRHKIDNLGKIRKKSRKLALKVVSRGGNLYTITGVNLNSYQFSGVKKEGRFSGLPEVFVDLPRVHELLTQVKEAREKLNSLEETLTGYQLTNLFGRYSQRIGEDPEDYERALQQLEAWYQELLTKADTSEARL